MTGDSCEAAGVDTITKDDIVRALRSLGMPAGQVVYAQADLSRPGRIEGVTTRESFCQAYLDSILEIIGSEGTLVVPTYTTQVARYDIDFVWEETPSLMGIFSEHVRRLPDSLRSIHPISSVCAIGRDKEFICGGNGTSNFGWDSPFHRMLMKKAKILAIGLESGYAVGIAHHLEAACDLPYVYNKLLKWKPIVNGKEDTRQFYGTVRHLDLDVAYDLTKWVKHMRELGGIESAKLGGSWLHMSDYEQVFMEGVKLLREDPYVFLKTPPAFTYGKIPFDGPTGGQDDVSNRDDKTKLQSMNWPGYYFRNVKYAGGDDPEIRQGERQ